MPVHVSDEVFGLIAAFLDEACVEFGKRLQSKSSDVDIPVMTSLADA